MTSRLDEPILHFNTGIAREKPNSVHLNSPCPFCETEKLTNILAVEEPMILLENKYPVIQDSYPLLIIETDQCESDLSEYTEAHVQKVIRFGLEHWLEMEKDPAYKSVIFYKNHGPLSGGTIRHPHMQIIGLKNADYREALKEAYFEGVAIATFLHVRLNISTEPMIGFTEFNIVMTHLDGMAQFAKSIQQTVQFLYHYFKRHEISYNLFFYHWKNQIIAKVVPRFPTSPLFVGYRLRQVSNNLEGVIIHYKKFIENK